jgi:hypothetical protein
LIDSLSLRFIKLGTTEEGGVGFIWRVAVILLEESSFINEINDVVYPFIYIQILTGILELLIEQL